MEKVDERVETLKKLFRGRQDAYGQIIDGEEKCIRKPITDKLLLQHLQGEERIGIYLLTLPDNTVYFACIDVDEENRGKVESIYAVLIDHSFYPYLERSRAKGYHIWVFLDEAIKASLLRIVLKGILKEVGISDVEIFPKQDAITSNNGVGNFVFLPLYGESVKQDRTVFLNMNFEPHPDQIEVLRKVHFTKTENILELSKQYPEKLPEPRMMPAQPGDNSLGALDVEKYLNQYGVKHKVKQESNRTFFLLDRCLFADQHTKKDTSGDSSIVQGADGKLGFQCFHHHCSDKTWADARKAISGETSIVQFCRGYVAPSVSLTHKRGEGRSLSDILKEPDAEEKYLVKPILSRGDKGFVVSSYKIGKTLLLIQLTLCLSMAVPFLGFEIPHPAKVLYIRFELKNHRFRKRLLSMVKGLGGIDGIKVEPVFELVRGFNLLDKKDFDWLTRLIEKHGPEVLMIDPLYKIASIDLKDTANAMPLIRRFDSIIEAYPDLLLVTAHHLRKQAGDEKETWDSTYGPMFFFADMDFEIRLKAKHRENPEFTFDYISNDIPVEPFTFKRNPESLLYYVSNPEDDHIDEIIDYAEQNKPSKGSLKEWLISSFGHSRRQAENVVDRIVKSGQLAYEGKGTRGKLIPPREAGLTPVPLV